MSLVDLPSEILLHILLHIVRKLHYHDLINLSQVPVFSKFLQDPYVWFTKLSDDMNNSMSRRYFDDTPLSPAERYLEIMSLYSSRIFRGSEKYIPLDHCLLCAIRSNDVTLVRYFLQFAVISIHGIRVALQQAAALNHAEIIELLMPHPGADVEWGFNGAVIGGHRQGVDYFMARGAKYDPFLGL